MKFRNPHYADPVQAAAEALSQKIDVYLKTKAASEFVGLGRLKAEMPEAGAAKPAVINAALALLGVERDEDGDDDA